MTFDKLQQNIHAVSGQVNYQVSKEAKFDTNKQMVDRGITLRCHKTSLFFVHFTKNCFDTVVSTHGNQQ